MDKIVRVLVVDDHIIVREGLSKWLRGYLDIDVVGEATNGLEAANLARSLCPDVIIMDVNMPKMDGLEATKIIISELPKTCIIGFSVNGHIKIVSAMKAAGAANFFTKDCNLDNLLSAIRDFDITK